MNSRFSVVALLFVLVVTACTSGGDDPSENDTTTEAPATTEAPVTTETPATEAPTTEAEEAPTTEVVLSAEEQVRAAHTFYMTEHFDRDGRVEGVIPDEELTAILTGSALERAREVEALDEETGERVAGPGYVSNIVSVEIDGNSATVADCSQGRGVLYAPDGETVVIPADDFFKIRTTTLVLIDDTWLISDFNTGGDPCNPDDS